MKCKICKSKKTNILEKEIRGMFNLYVCSVCSTVWAEPQEEYDFDKPGKTIKSTLLYYLSFIPFYRYYHKLISNSIKHDSILDVACGHGTLLKIYRYIHTDILGRFNKKILGIEPNPTPYLKNIPFIKSTVENVNLDNKFDIINMKDILEHLKNPSGVLEMVISLLNYEGTLVISVPDIDSEEAISKGRCWKHIAPREHRFYFSEKSLDYICCKLGLAKGPSMSLFKGGITCFYYKL